MNQWGGYSKKDLETYVNGFVILAIAVAVAVFIVLVVAGDDKPLTDRPAPPRPKVAVPAQPPAPVVEAPIVETPPQPVRKTRVTKADYLKIREGMSYREVVEIVGFHGSEDASASFQGITSKVYSWDNGDGSAMTATFTNGRMDAKGQFGLR